MFVLADAADQSVAVRGQPLDHAAMADWAGERVGLSFIPPGEPLRNGYVELFNAALATKACTSVEAGRDGYCAAGSSLIGLWLWSMFLS